MDTGGRGDCRRRCRWVSGRLGAGRGLGIGRAGREEDVCGGVWVVYVPLSQGVVVSG